MLVVSQPSLLAFALCLLREPWNDRGDSTKATFYVHNEEKRLLNRD